jgi:hypothetical protein
LFKNGRNKLSFTEELKNQKILVALNLRFCLIIANLLTIFGMYEIDTNPKVSLEIASFKVSINISNILIFSVDMSINSSPFFFIHYWHLFHGCLSKDYIYIELF